MPVLLPALERHGHMRLEGTIRAKLLGASAATIDRVLAPTRASVRGHRNRRRATPAVQRAVPVRTFADWKEPLPGFMEADLVAHCGDALVGSFVHTLTLTDIASGWTECAVLVLRQATLVVHAVETLRTRMPFPLRGLDTDNGTEFMNETLLAYCSDHGSEFTRSRPYHKNDQAWVEQKNGAIVRRLIGYRRLEGMAAAAILSRVYASARLFVNFFQPSFKLAEKTRVGARVRKRYHAPATPAARLLASDAVPDSTKDQLRAVAEKLDPLQLLDEIRTLQRHLVELADGNAASPAPRRGASLDRFLKGLAKAWQQGEVRPTHQTAPRPLRSWRTREDPFEAVWPQVRAWLEAEPDRTAKELFQRLRGEHAGIFLDGQLRTLQRRVSEWRGVAARNLVFASDAAEPAGDRGP